MNDVWPWLAVAALGALHGLNPATGWMFAAAWGVRAGDRSLALRALAPIALGHTASMALVGAAVVGGLAIDRAVVQAIAVVLLVASVAIHFTGGAPARARAPAGHAGLALWAFIMSGAHGAGLTLVPALLPLCMGAAGGAPVETADALARAAAAVLLHTAAMLAVTGAIASGICRAFDARARRWRPCENPPR